MLRYWCRIVILLLALIAVSARAGPTAGQSLALPAADRTGGALLPVQAMLDGYPQLHQQHTLSCEAAAVSMATQGLVAESTIVASMPVNSNPWLGFRGTIDGHATLANGLANYGIYAPPLAREMQDFGYQTAVISGTAAPALLRYSIGVLHLPVVAWVTYRLHSERSIVGRAGARTFPLVRFEHARLVVGYDARGIYTNDPLDGPRYDPWQAFLRAWGTFDDMGLIITPTFPHYEPPVVTSRLSGDAVTWSWPRSAWPLVDEATVFRAGQPLQRFLLAHGAQSAADAPQPLFPVAGGDATVAAGASLIAMPLDASLPAAPYVPVDAVLDGRRAGSGTESLTVRLAQSIPYTITVSAVDPLGVVSPAATSSTVVDR
ncbi:MAG TPA: C39 family peptidase, partial [Chloroflexota bacterium]|nr:C39 family peptidase [Chloroflexota bacterium]